MDFQKQSTICTSIEQISCWYFEQVSISRSSSS